MEKYLNYILEAIIRDAQVYDNWWMWTVLPAIFYTIFLILKYAILTLPIWLPFNLMFSPFRRSQILPKPKKEKDEVNKGN